MNKIVYLLLTLNFATNCICQNLGYMQNWYISSGNGLKIDTLTGLPNGILNNPLTQVRGTTAVVNNELGNLNALFFGDVGFDKNFQLFPTSQTPNTFAWLASQGIIETKIIKLPGTNKKYLVLLGGIYNYFDLNLNNGLGDFTFPNFQRLLLSTSFNAFQNYSTIVQHCNGSDFWLITHEINGSNRFLSFLIDSSGVQSTPVFSQVGTIYSFPSCIGYYSSYKNGTRLVAGITPNSSGAILEFFDINISNGTISSSNSLNVVLPSTILPISLAISDNEQFLYLSTVHPGGGGPDVIYQINISNLNSQAMLNSIIKVHDFPPITPAQPSYLSKSTNGVILFNPVNTSKIGALLNPNLSGLNCNPVDSIWGIQNVSSVGSLPTFLNAGIIRPTPIIKDIQNDTLTICPSSSLFLQSDTLSTWSWQWKLNGTDIPGATQSSYSATQPGIYQVQFISPTGCKGKTSKPITLLSAPSPNIPGINYFSDTLFSTVSADSFSWSLNGTPIASDSFLANPSSGVYILTIWNAEGCSASSSPFTLTHTDKEFTQNIRVYPNPTDGLVTIELPKPIQADYLITDVTGKDCLKGSIPYNLMKTSINLSSLPSGLYFIRLSSEQGQSVFRVLVE